MNGKDEIVTDEELLPTSNGAVHPEATRQYVVFCRMPPHLYKSLERLAEEQHRTLPNMVRFLIAQAVRH